MAAEPLVEDAAETHAVFDGEASHPTDHVGKRLYVTLVERDGHVDDADTLAALKRLGSNA